MRFHWHLLFHEGCNPSCCRNHSHIIEEQEGSPSLLEVSANTKFFDREPFPQHHICAPCYEGLALMPFSVWFGRFVCFIYIALHTIWHTSFSFLSAQTEQYIILISGNDHPWICWNIFVWCSHYQILLLLPTPFDITYKNLIFLAAWQLFKCGILTLPDRILHTGSLLLHMVSHFTGIVNNI